jgi:hypothetical protein
MFPVELTITVTQEDIDLGQKCETMHCPIARAAERAFGHPVAIGLVGIYDPLVVGKVLCEIPDWVALWIEEFDSGPREMAPPIEFTVTVPDPDRVTV